MTLDPREALDEIALRLEAERATKFKARAFRRAAAIIEELDDEELAARLRDGRLARTDGIGDRTLQVIREAAEGGIPSYLADLRRRAGEEDDPASALRALLRGDLHAHSEWSDGTTSIRAMAEQAKRIGHEYLALTDHSPRLRVARGLSAERLAEQLEVVAELNGELEGITVLSGIEVDILEGGKLDQTPEMLDRLDVVVASAHSKLRAERGAMTRRLVGAARDPHTNVLGHVTGRLVEGSRGTRPQSEFDAERVFAACAENDVAVEINSRPERQDPPDDLLALAVDAGCLFAIDSDAHAPGHLGFVDLGAARAEAAGIPAERIVTTWPRERLLEWSRARR